MNSADVEIPAPVFEKSATECKPKPKSLRGKKKKKKKKLLTLRHLTSGP